MSEFTCNICNNSYKHKQSLSRHKKLKHSSDNNDNNEFNLVNDNNNAQKCIQKCIQNVSKVYPRYIHDISNEGKVYKCKYCDKEFKYSSGKYKHQKNCKHSSKHSSDDIMTAAINAIKDEIMEMMNKKFKIHHKTFEKL